MERFDELRLREMKTTELLRHAVEEARLLARAEVLHAKEELRDELKGARRAGIFLGIAAVAALCALFLLLAALAVALPWADWVGLVVVGVICLFGALACAVLAKARVPRRPMSRTRQRLRHDVTLTREQLA